MLGTMQYLTTRREISGVPVGYNGRTITLGSQAMARSIKKRLALMKLSNASLADRLDCSPANVSAVLSGRTNFPHRHVDQWAQALGYEGEDLSRFRIAASLTILDADAYIWVDALRDKEADVLHAGFYTEDDMGSPH